MTRRARPYFRLSEYPNGDFFIVMEQRDGDRLQMMNRSIGFDLPSRINVTDAELVRKYLSDKLIFVTES